MISFKSTKNIEINKWKLGIGLLLFPNGWNIFFIEGYTILSMLSNLVFLLSVYLICNSIEVSK
jgi:hypothetical protein